MSAYLQLLCERHSTEDYPIRQIPYKYVGRIMEGRFRDEKYQLIMTRVGIIQIEHI